MYKLQKIKVKNISFECKNCIDITVYEYAIRQKVLTNSQIANHDKLGMQVSLGS